ncbi:MAG: NUDIX domain-containing protein [Planctomycetaceae bacterium]|nr:NUDIX domain-containing protein [Planctomycetaceae bacterium]
MCSQCSYRHYFSPCAAVGAIVLNEHHEVLLIIRGKEPGQGLLGLPGGFVDAGETAEDALVREVYEELHLNVTTTQYVASYPNNYSFAGVTIPVTDLFFAVTVARLKGIRVQKGEVDGWVFRDAASLRRNDLAFETHYQALRAWQSMQK